MVASSQRPNGWIGLNRDFHKLLNRAFRARQSADYDLDFDLDDVEVRELIAEGEAFLDAATSYLESSTRRCPTWPGRCRAT